MRHSLRSLALLATAACVIAISSAEAGPAVAAGTSHAVVLTDVGIVWTWGANGSGQLGIGNTSGKTVPTEVTSIFGITAIAAGGDSTYVLKSDGTVWAWGANGSGQLGDGSTTNRTSAVRVGTLTNIVAIAAGSLHGLALKNDGTLWAWGANGAGQIGDGTTTTRTSPVQVTSLSTNVAAIAAADLHSHAVKLDGTVVAWGRNQRSEAGDGTTTTPRTSPVVTGSLSSMLSVDAGYYHAFAWDASHDVKGWGYNVDGELADGSNSNRTSPVTLSSLNGAVAIRGGYGHTVVALSDGTVLATGLNSYGQVGDGTTTNRNTTATLSGLDDVVAVAAGQYFSAAVSDDGRVWTWGRNNSGQLGDGTTLQRNAPIQISDASFDWRVATPTFSPNGGSFTVNTNVTVSVVTAGATIHYTTNGQDPTTSDATVTSGNSVAITQSGTLKARAWLSGRPASNIAVATFTLTAVMPTVSPNGGTFSAVQSVTISTTTSGAQIRYTTDGSTPTASSTLYSSALSIGTGTVVKAIAVKSGWSNSGVRTSTFVFNYGLLGAPVFDPVSGTYAYGQQVALSAAAGATIRYAESAITHEFTHVDFVKVQVYNAMLKEESIPYSSKAACDAALPSAYQRVQRAFRRALQDTQRMHQ